MSGLARDRRGEKGKGGMMIPSLLTVAPLHFIQDLVPQRPCSQLGPHHFTT